MSAEELAHRYAVTIKKGLARDLVLQEGVANHAVLLLEIFQKIEDSGEDEATVLDGIDDELGVQTGTMRTLKEGSVKGLNAFNRQVRTYMASVRFR